MKQKIRRLLPTILLGVLIFLPTIARAAEWYHECKNKVKSKATFVRAIKSYTRDKNGACWFCSIFESIFDAINNLATDVFTQLASSFVKLLGIGILFIILFKVAKMVIRLQEVDVMQFLDDLFKPLGRAIIAFALLMSGLAVKDNVFSMITNPILGASLELGYTLMDTALSSDKTVEYLNPGVGSGTWNYQASTCTSHISTSTGGDGKALQESEKEMLVCWMKEVSSSFMAGVAIGGALISAGFDAGPLDGLSMIMIGFVLWAAFYLIYIMFPFKLIDAFTRLAFVLTLIPLWIVLWVFPATAGYTKKAWEMFLSSVFIFTTISVMICLVIYLMNEAIPKEDGSGKKIRDGLLTCLRYGDNEAAATWVPFGGGALLNTLAFGAMSLSLLKSASTIANSFVGGGGDLGIGNSMTSIATRGAMLGAGVAKAGAKMGYTAGDAVVGKTASAINAGLSYLGTPAAGARASKLNRFFQGAQQLGNKTAGGAILGGLANLGDRLKNGPRAATTPYNPETVGQDFGRLDTASQNRVNDSVNRDMAAINNEFATNGSGGWRGSRTLGDIKNRAGSAEERNLLERIMRGKEKGQNPSEKDLAALRDVRARQMMAQNPMAEKAYADRRAAADAQADARSKISSLSAARRKGDRALADWKDQNCRTVAEREAVDKYIRDSQKPGQSLKAVREFQQAWAAAQLAKAGTPGADGRPDPRTTSTPDPRTASTADTRTPSDTGTPPSTTTTASDDSSKHSTSTFDESSSKYGRFNSAIEDIRNDHRAMEAIENLRKSFDEIAQLAHSGVSKEQLLSSLSDYARTHLGTNEETTSALQKMAERLQDADRSPMRDYITKDAISDYLRTAGGIAESDVIAKQLTSQMETGGTASVSSRLNELKERLKT